MRALMLMTAMVLSPFASAATLHFKIVKRNAAQGDVVVIQRIDRFRRPFRVRFLDREYRSFIFRNRQTVFLGIPYQLKPGPYIASAVCAMARKMTSSVPIPIRVRQKYPRLPYKPPKRSPAEQQRINHEVAENHIALRHTDLHLSVMKEFTWPMRPVVVTSKFGERRCRDRRGRHFFNCRYHLGTDYRAAFDRYHQDPVPIHAINDGVVLSTASHVIDGHIVIVDHGNGISAEYLHFSKTLVVPGEYVRRGQVIGIAGKTGDSDAVHLHLTIKMDHGRTIIDPQRFLLKVAHH
ncbi:MAG: M23 family metallopeptidase [Patescibacteria group bacterium]|nr:M23 family metallopeptidase [Patescibacteria group bacterium]